MRIGVVAKILGVSCDTIRRLERRGLVKPGRDWAGHRRFSPNDLEQLRDMLFHKGGEHGAS